ncbi:MAG: CoA transferase [Alphaproteobacteria bacterium]|nr:CoA transferase [Alphaproteobacteria bacterium]MCY4320344.1 CoA transferase [Alphaproteobacteria bacterium]
MPRPQSGAPPLQGIKVVDFSRVIAGPLCTQVLADMGAEVIKIENPETGDDTRRMAEPGAAGESHFFLAFNRNKKSLALDIRTPEGKEIVFDLLAGADVVVENFRVGVMKRFGFDYAALAERFPQLVYLSVSAYGQDGPMADRPGFDPVMQAEFGMMSLTGEPDGQPLRHPLSLIDTMTALYAAASVNAALLARRETGRGQYVELALADVAVAALGNAGLYYLCSGAPPPRTGNSHMTSTPTNLFETADGPLYMALGTDRLFGQLCRDVLDRPDLPQDPRFASPAARLANRPALFAILDSIFKGHPRAYWLAKMRHLPAGPVRTIAEALESEEVAHRGMVRHIEHVTAGPIRILGSPIRFSDTPVRVDAAPPPLHGGDTDAVLRGLGYDDARIAALRASGTLGKS